MMECLIKYKKGALTKVVVFRIKQQWHCKINLSDGNKPAKLSVLLVNA